MSASEQAKQLLKEMEELESKPIDRQTYAQLLEKFRALVAALDEVGVTGATEDAES